MALLLPLRNEPKKQGVNSTVVQINSYKVMTAIVPALIQKRVVDDSSHHCLDANTHFKPQRRGTLLLKVTLQERVAEDCHLSEEAVFDGFHQVLALHSCKQAHYLN